MSLSLLYVFMRCICEHNYLKSVSYVCMLYVIVCRHLGSCLFHAMRIIARGCSLFFCSNYNFSVFRCD